MWLLRIDGDFFLTTKITVVAREQGRFISDIPFPVRRTQTVRDFLEESIPPNQLITAAFDSVRAAVGRAPHSVKQA